MLKAYSIIKNLDKKACEIIRNAGIKLDISNSDKRPDREGLIKLLDEYDILIIGIEDKFTKDMLPITTKKKIIATLSIGLDHIDRAFLENDNIKIINCQTSNVISVAEHIFALILGLKKRIIEANDISLRGENRRNLSMRSNDITGSTLGLIGAGKISREVIRIMAMNTGLGLKMLMLTNGLDFSDGEATNFLLAVGLIADVIGIMALKYFTPKNDYLTLTIKFGIRMALYWIAYTSNDLTICLIAITWSILISTAYENITDAPYINRIKNEYQMVFTNVRYTVGLVGTSIGLYFAGIMYNYGITFNLGLSAFFVLFQLLLAYYLIYLRKKEGEKYEKNIKI